MLVIGLLMLLCLLLKLKLGRQCIAFCAALTNMLQLLFASAAAVQQGIIDISSSIFVNEWWCNVCPHLAYSIDHH